MIARKRIHAIVIALCLWLPLQAIAGQWLHCAQLDASLIQLEATAESAPHLSCHDISIDKQQPQLADTQIASTADIQSCKHCQFSCSWHSALLLREFIQPSINLVITYTQFNSLSPDQPLLAMPQRPPRLSA